MPYKLNGGDGSQPEVGGGGRGEEGEGEWLCLVDILKNENDETESSRALSRSRSSGRRFYLSDYRQWTINNHVINPDAWFLRRSLLRSTSSLLTVY